MLAALGINTFFSGTRRLDIAVNAEVAADARRIAAGLPAAGDSSPATARNAAALAALADQGVGHAAADCPCASTTRRWSPTWPCGPPPPSDTADAAQVVQDSLTAQRESVSGVSLDEEAVNLIQYQRAFQGSARFITVVNELLDTLLKLRVPARSELDESCASWRMAGIYRSQRHCGERPTLLSSVRSGNLDAGPGAAAAGHRQPPAVAQRRSGRRQQRHEPPARSSSSSSRCWPTSTTRDRRSSTSTDQALGDAADLLLEAYTTAQANVGSMTHADAAARRPRRSISQLMDQMLTAGQHQVGDVYIFGGTANTDVPFVSEAAGHPLRRGRPGHDGPAGRAREPMQVGLTGDEVFGALSSEVPRLQGPHPAWPTSNTRLADLPAPAATGRPARHASSSIDGDQAHDTLDRGPRPAATASAT